MKGGTSKVKKEVKPTHKVLIRFTEAEYSLVKNNIRISRLFIQSYFRLLIKGIRPREMPEDDFFALLNCHRMIHINLVQLTAKALFLEMPEANTMWAVEKSFNEHCAEIKALMLNYGQLLKQNNYPFTKDQR